MKIGKFVFFSVIVTVLALSVQRLGAQIPPHLQYQGRLANSVTGGALNEPVGLEFSIFDAPTGGTVLWTETYANVIVKDGFFAVPLGSVNPLSVLPFDKPYYLEVTINNETMFPRMPFSPAPYAFKAASVDAGAIDAGALATDVVDPVGGLGQNDDGALKIAADGVTSSMIQDGTIADVDVSPEASIVLATASQTLTNKTFDATLNILTNVMVSDFAEGEVADDLAKLLPQNPDQLPTALAVKEYVDGASVGDLGDLRDTLLTSPAFGDLLVWDAAAQAWVNEALTGDMTIVLTNGILTSSIVAGSVGFGELDGGMLAADAMAIAAGDSSRLTTASGVLEFVDVELRELAWQATITSFWDPSVMGLPGNAQDGDRYIASASANGWDENSVYEYYTDMPDGPRWVETPPMTGMTCWLAVPSPGRHYTFSEGMWAPTDPFDSIGDHIYFRNGLTVEGDVALGNESTDLINIVGEATLESGVQFSGLETTVVPGMVLASKDSFGTLDWLALGPEHIGKGVTSLSSASSSTDSGAALIGAHSGTLTNATGSNVQQILEQLDTQITAVGVPQNAISAIQTPDDIVMNASSASATLDFIEGPGIEITGTAGVRSGSTSRSPFAVTVGLASASFTLTSGAGLTGGGTVSLGGSTTIDLDAGLAGDGLGLSEGVLGIKSGDGLQIVADQLGVKADPGIFAFGTSQELTLQQDIDGALLGFNADKVDGKGVDDAGDTDQFLWTAQKIQDHVTAEVEGYGPSTEELNWRRTVVAFWDPSEDGQGLPKGASLGQRYIASGPWNQDGTVWNPQSVYERIEGGWEERVPGPGDTVYSQFDGMYSTFRDSAWTPMEAAFKHDDLAELAGGWNPVSEQFEHYHLNADQAGMLDELQLVPTGYLLAVVGSEVSPSRVKEANLLDWVKPGGNNISVSSAPDGGVTVSLTGVTSVGDDLVGVSGNLATAGAISEYVSDQLNLLTLAGLADTQFDTPPGEGEYLRFDGVDSKWKTTLGIPGADVQRALDGGIVDDSGLKVALDGTSLEITGSGLKVKLPPVSALGIVEAGLDVLDNSIDEFHLSGLQYGDPGQPGHVLASDGAAGFIWTEGTPFIRADYGLGQESWEHALSGAGTDAMAGASSDGEGNIYVADPGNNRVLKFNSALLNIAYLEGASTGWVAGVAPGSSAQSGTADSYFSGPTDVAVDETSSPAVLYVADADNGRVVKIDLASGVFLANDIGVKSTVASLQYTFYPQGLGVDESGALFVADGFNAMVHVFDPSGNLLGWYGKGATSSGWHSYDEAAIASPSGTDDTEFAEPGDVAVSSDYGVFVTDVGLNRVQVLLHPALASANGPGGDYVSEWTLEAPINIAILGEDGTVAVSSLTRHVVNLYDAGGTLEATFGTLGTPGITDGEFDSPRGVAMVHDGLIVVDSVNSRLQKFLAPRPAPPSIYSMALDGSSVAIGAMEPSMSAVFQIDSTNGGILIPRMSESDIEEIDYPENGLLVYQNDYPDSGFRYYDSSAYAWKTLVASDDTGTATIENLSVPGNTTLGDEGTDNVQVNGKLQVASGTPGAGKVLVSDDEFGNASWQNVGAANVIYVNEGEGIQAAIDEFFFGGDQTSRSSGSLLVRVGPGVFDGKVFLPPNVAIEGAGIGVTIITSGGGEGTFDPTRQELVPTEGDATVSILGAYNSGLRNLTIDSNRSGAGVALGLWSEYVYGGVHLTNVAIQGMAYSGTDVCAGIYTVGEGPVLQNVSVNVSGDASEKTVGIWGRFGEWDIDRVTITTNPTTGTAVGVLCDDFSLAISDSRMWVDGGVTAAYGIWLRAQVYRSVTMAEIRGTIIEVDGYTQSSVAVMLEDGDAKIYHSQLFSRATGGYALWLAAYTSAKAYYTTASGSAGSAQIDQDANLLWRRCWDEMTDAELHSTVPSR